jgi:hypothetical protein
MSVWALVVDECDWRVLFWLVVDVLCREEDAHRVNLKR